MKIEINHVMKQFQNNVVLQDINIQMEEGNIYCLLGASGSGKTTLLRIIMGAISADEGQVLIEGIQVPNKTLLTQIGFMPQQDALYHELSIWDNLRFFAGIQNLKGKQFEKRAMELLKVVGLLEDKKKLVGNCSGGMRKRISLAATLIHAPQLIIMDEPTVGIDPVLRREIWEYLHRLKEQGTTIVVTTHVMDEVFQCDYAALLRNGKIIIKDAVSNLAELTSNGNIEDLFFLGEEETVCIQSLEEF